MKRAASVHMTPSQRRAHDATVTILRRYCAEDIAGYSGGATYLQPRDPRIALEPA